MALPSRASRRKTIGVLGGMGPDSTVVFFRKIIELTPAERDQDHIPVLIFNNPAIPDRTAAILRKGESPLDALKTGVTLLDRAGVDFITIPCNTAHFWYHELQQSCKLPILNMIDLVVAEARRLQSDLKQVGVLATKGTVQSRLYHDAFNEVGVDVLTPDAPEQDELQNLIQTLKNKQPRHPGEAKALVTTLADRGAETVVLGCTELSLIVSELTSLLPILDSTEILAQKSVKLALGHETLPAV